MQRDHTKSRHIVSYLPKQSAQSMYNITQMSVCEERCFTDFKISLEIMGEM